MFRFNSFLSVTAYCGLFMLGLLFGSCNSDTEMFHSEADPKAVEITNQLLDDNKEADERRELIEQNPELASEILIELVRDLETGTEEEARRIPWIWRVTITAGSRNDEAMIRQIMDISLPEKNTPLLNWQAVVLGGGIVNGISRQGNWPEQRIDEILEGYNHLKARWQWAVEFSYELAGDPEVPYPWRYDALRMIAMDSQNQSIPELSSYLDPEFDGHLHMGAISGLSDIRSPEVPPALISGLSYFSERNRDLAVDGLLRTDERIEALLNAVTAGKLSTEDIGEERIEQLKTHENENLRNRAQQVLAK